MTDMASLKGSDKTKISTLETDLQAAIDALDPQDRVQFGTREVLKKMRLMLEVIRIERMQ